MKTNFGLDLLSTFAYLQNMVTMLCDVIIELTCCNGSVNHGRQLDNGRVAKLPGVALPADSGVSGRRSVKLEQELVVLLLQQHDTVLEEEDVEVDGLETSSVAQFQGQRAVVDQPMFGQVQVLKRKKMLCHCYSSRSLYLF